MSTKTLAAKQISKAYWGSDLDNWRDAKPTNMVLTTPTTVGDAEGATAYWMALGARILNSRSLAASAQWMVADVPGKWAFDASSRDPKKIREVITTGSGKLAEALKDAKTDAQRTQIYEILTMMGSWVKGGRVEQQQHLAPTQTEMVKEKVEDAGEKGFNFLEFFNGIITGKRPGYITEGKWPFVKWGTRIVVGSLALGVAGVALKPYTAPIRRLYRRTRGSEGNPEEAITLTHHKNPRKRRRRRSK